MIWELFELVFAAWPVLCVAPLFVFSPSCQCCEVYGDPCSHCSDTTKTPLNIQITLAGFTDRICGSGNACSTLHGTWDATQLTGVNDCLWTVDSPPDPCTYTATAIQADLSFTGGTDLRGQVIYNAGTGVVSTWLDNSTGYDDCHSWSLFDIAHSGDLGAYPCNAGTFKVTTV